MNGILASVIAIYNYNDKIFDGLTLPAVSDLQTTADLIDTITPLDKNALVNNILFECGELTLVYTDPDTISKMIEIWSKINQYNWLHLWETMLYKYNPIWNKDGSYHESISRSGRVDGGSEIGYGRTVAHNVTGFDTNAYSPDTQDVTGGKDTTKSGSMFSNGEMTDRTETGNIGVTTTQQMIKEQREIVEFNIYEYITKQFKERFCVMVY